MDFYFDDELSGLLEWNSIEKPKIFSGLNSESRRKNDVIT